MARPLWLAAGGLFFVLGWIGMVMPMMPGFVFLLCAVFCLARGKPEWAEALRAHPEYGPPLNDWFDRRAISRKAKRSASVAMALAAGIALWLVAMPWVLISLGAMAAAAAWIWTRPE